jgi:hypothetical protein
MALKGAKRVGDAAPTMYQIEKQKRVRKRWRSCAKQVVLHPDGCGKVKREHETSGRARRG